VIYFRYLILDFRNAATQNKRKKQLAAVQDGIGKRQRTSKLREETLNVPKEDSSPIDAIVVPDTITSLHGKKRTPTAEAAT
jgi:hypothetical protein